MTERLAYGRAAPGGLKALLDIKAYLDGCGLPAALLDLVYLRVSQINGCAYCIDVHSHDLFAHGASPAKLLLTPVWREAWSLFSEKERPALAWAETVTVVSETRVGDAAYAEAAAAFTARELSDLTIAIGLMGVFNRLAISFRTPPSTQGAF